MLVVVVAVFMVTSASINDVFVKHCQENGNASMPSPIMSSTYDDW